MDNYSSRTKMFEARIENAESFRANNFLVHPNKTNPTNNGGSSSISESFLMKCIKVNMHHTC